MGIEEANAKISVLEKALSEAQAHEQLHAVEIAELKAKNNAETQAHNEHRKLTTKLSEQLEAITTQNTKLLAALEPKKEDTKSKKG